jgi:hypothetical protein
MFIRRDNQRRIFDEWEEEILNRGSGELVISNIGAFAATFMIAILTRRGLPGTYSIRVEIRLQYGLRTSPYRLQGQRLITTIASFQHMAHAGSQDHEYSTYPDYSRIVT